MGDVQAKRLGELIAAARRIRGWSLRELASRTSIPHAWLGDLEQGQYRQPAPDRITLVAKVLDLPVNLVDEAMGGTLIERAPDWRQAVRLRFSLSAEETQQVEDFVLSIVRERGDKPGEPGC